MKVLRMTMSGQVSIHTRHYWRVKQRLDGGLLQVQRVSIHTRHYWRVKRPSLSAVLRPLVFQSTPAITGG